MNYDGEYTNISLDLHPSCVVGIGASAGGLEALQQLLTFLPGDTGMSFVIVQHLSPAHKSMLTDILGKYTSMPVLEARDGMQVKRNHIYMIPPKYNLEIEADVLKLREYNHQQINHPIDIFFRSLARSFENRSVAVILSGTGSDGTNGIRSIKEQNGVIIVQSPESAKFDGMPRNAIATGFVDLILNPDSIAREMAHISASMMDSSGRLQMSDADLLSQIFSILKDVTGVNYTYYKKTTILRRIERRIVITHNRNLREYVNYLSNNPEESRLLGKEVLIGVTSFFRDPDYFDVLKDQVITELIKKAKPADQIRVWVAGCSTGEEAYSVAILFDEVQEELGLRRDVKIFATDLDAESISMAGRGSYGDNIIEDVSVFRLSRNFTRKGNRYYVNHNIRKMIVFAQHNVFQDPPFGRLDLICCRNLLIYFQNVLQRNLFAIFNMALKDRGFLFLGRSESVGDYDDVFRTFCPNEKIFIHNIAGKAPNHERITYLMNNVENHMEPVNPVPREDFIDVKYSSSELDTKVLETLLPASVLVDDKNELIHSYGDCSRFITIPVGSVTLDIFSLIRTDLKIAISKALKESREANDKVSYDQIPVTIDGRVECISMYALPIRNKLGETTGVTALVFVRGQEQAGQDGKADMEHFRIDTAAAQRITDLEKELHITQDDLKKTVTELEAVNAELQAANEELLTANEELQSSNEELQSVNEELYTVNSEYQAKVGELTELNSDMANFLSITLVGILMVDRELNIRRYTDYISKEFNVVEQDVGRSLRFIAYNFATIDLIDLCRKVLATSMPIEQHCASVSGKTYLFRIAPYRILQGIKDSPVPEENEVKGPVRGLVLTFVDTTKQIGDRKQIDEMARALRDAVRQGQEKERFLSHMSHDMRTPMTAITGLTDLTLELPGLPPEARDNLEKIQASNRYLMGMIDEILETSRINAGKVVTVAAAVREEKILQDISNILEDRAGGAGIHFRTRIQGSKNRFVMMDVEHVERILLNLLSNAIKFTPAGGDVLLGTDVTYEGSRAIHVYTVQDNGPGISEAFQNRMFLPFEQEAKDALGMHDGTGLGLYICKNLVDLLGGTINCRSTPGIGTTFTVRLTYDLATEEQIRIQGSGLTSYEDRVLYGKTVLIAEDNNINAEVIVKILETKGIHSERAIDGQDAIDMFQRKGAYYYQAILMDVMMPGKNGIEAARDIRRLKVEDALTVPIIALTADASEDTDEKCLQAGMNAALKKPVENEMLFYTLAKEFEKSVRREGRISL